MKKYTTEYQPSTRETLRELQKELKKELKRDTIIVPRDIVLVKELQVKIKQEYRKLREV